MSFPPHWDKTSRCPICGISRARYREYARHQRDEHSDCWRANLSMGDKEYRAASSALPRCELCNIYIGSKPDVSHIHSRTELHLFRTSHQKADALFSVQAPTSGVTETANVKFHMKRARYTQSLLDGHEDERIVEDDPVPNVEEDDQCDIQSPPPVLSLDDDWLRLDFSLPIQCSG